MEHISEIDRITMATPEYAALRESMREKLKNRRILTVVVLAHIAEDEMSTLHRMGSQGIRLETIERVCRKKISLIKTVREMFGMGLKDAKDLVDNDVSEVEKDVKAYWLSDTNRSLL